MSAKPRTFVQRAFDPDEYDEIVLRSGRVSYEVVNVDYKEAPEGDPEWIHVRRYEVGRIDTPVLAMRWEIWRDLVMTGASS